MKKSKVKLFITNHIWLILAIFLFSFALSYWVITLENRYKKDEKFSIFVESWGINNEKLFKDIEEEIKEKISSFNYYCYAPDDINIASYYSRFGNESDILILKESDLIESKEGIKSTFLILDEKILNICDRESFYVYEDYKYGIKIYDNNDVSYNKNNPISSDYIFDKEDESFYLLVNKKSVHFGKDKEIGYKVLKSLLHK